MPRIFNLGSINADHAYRVARIPRPGETLSASGLTTGLGGKGANQSVAAARAGGQVIHVGAVGPGAGPILSRLDAFGVDTARIREVETPTGHAIIAVDDEGENAIIVFGGANVALGEDDIATGLADAGAGDFLLVQNETSGQVGAARLARDRGCRVIYSAAPFDADAVAAVLPHVSILMMNEGEAEELRSATGRAPDELGLDGVVVTLGAKGARWIGHNEAVEVPGVRVDPVDTTGAGDTFAGYFAAGLAEGMDPGAAMRLAAHAAAIQVTRPGAAEAIPARAEVDQLLAKSASSPQS